VTSSESRKSVSRRVGAGQRLGPLCLPSIRRQIEINYGPAPKPLPPVSCHHSMAAYETSRKESLTCSDTAQFRPVASSSAQPCQRNVCTSLTCTSTKSANDRYADVCGQRCWKRLTAVGSGRVLPVLLPSTAAPGSPRVPLSPGTRRGPLDQGAGHDHHRHHRCGMSPRTGAPSRPGPASTQTDTRPAHRRGPPAARGRRRSAAPAGQPAPRRRIRTFRPGSTGSSPRYPTWAPP
jgi:hypothetical protein